VITNTLCQFLTQTGFREPLKGKIRDLSENVDRALYEAFIGLPDVERTQRARLVIYTIASYMALC